MKQLKYIVSKKTDYISFTVEKYDMRFLGVEIEKMDSIPMKNYDEGFTTDTGARVFTSTKDKRVGTHVVLSGNALDCIRSDGTNDIELCQYLMDYPNCRISRIDIAITSYRADGGIHELQPTAIHNLANSDKLVSKLKPDKGVINDETVETAYIGSRKARNRLFRAYDKGLDLGLDQMKTIRFELETRKRAKQIVNAIANNIDIGGIIRKYVDFPSVDVWMDIMSAESVVMPHIDTGVSPIEKKANDRANRWHWLLTSVAPAMARALFEDNIEIEDNENLRLFGVRVASLYEELKENRNEK